MQLPRPAPIAESPLTEIDLPKPLPGPGQLLVRVLVCGICHTDLHLVEGDIKPPRYPITPGHQIVGQVEAVGEGSMDWSVGDRVGIPWLHQACGRCSHCLRGDENLCAQSRFTGFHVDGGFADYALSEAAYSLAIPEAFDSEAAAPLLCAGIIGYRSLRKADLQPGERLGLIGFGASAHLAIQVARHWECQVFVFTRSQSHRRLAGEEGAAWVGGIDDQAPEALDRAIIFAPRGDFVPLVMEKLRPGGTLALNAIHMSPIPQMEYGLIYGERTLRSVANATFQDGVEFMQLAREIPIRTKTKIYPLSEANQALQDLKASTIDGAGVLIP